ncbi:LLM class F420-dependent oxidoreductase [Mycobacterium kubicae]|uniref:LLM class F420-dependent oxidoreductase n=1 Tax=Mycobacterium kubicae TaxID=120959 RepID=A0AAX1JI32_9MYCO|nr:LLM class F420-dependent oxidoreductase [Mycobacterium kubicae]MCV7093915.1 LLM class F420-dependent oxidoreductase [Mycobacterium kubicae]OBF15106.1 LLM class F420-dependent oxidoreductase [Mycobacterium kubicae]OBK52147.1 LLM class F420-dependent oxidoreductase [Mycobacterium kubicae]ORV96060.1 LLM class F420-dependent oxidoreductase [Mycobacterium kubicae]QNI06943.1 LLM class F420-dependent oxidoreductase [Mycobacterium kubicae]
MRYAIATFVTDEGIAPDRLAVAVEERGFDSLIVTEHSHMPVAYHEPYAGAGTPGREYFRTLDPFVVLTAAAAATRNLSLMTGVILLPQRDVLYTAKEVASLDLVAQGRFRLGVGVGWNEQEMRHCGVDPVTRGVKMTEQVRALKQIWTQDIAEFHGRIVDFAPIYSWPKPVQRPHPPIYVGGGSRAALRRLRDVGDGWLAPPMPANDIAQARQWLADNGRGDIAITLFAATANPKALVEYAAAGVNESAFLLPTMPEQDSLRELDRLAELVTASGEW